MAAYVCELTYECVGPGVEIADAHYRAVDAARAEHFAFMRRHGAVALRPSKWCGDVQSLLFSGNEAPSGWRIIGREDGDRIECYPDQRTKLGKALIKEFSALPKAPGDRHLAGQFDFHESPMDGNRIFWPTAVRVLVPTTRTFLRLPRTEGDGWPGHPGLAEVSEGEMMRALEAHNAAARAQQQAAE